MTVHVEMIEKATIKRLISAELGNTLSKEALEIMLRAVRNSEFIWVGSDNETTLCFWGLIPPSLMSDTAYLWLYTMPVLTEHRFLLVRHSQRVIENMLKQYPVIVGHCAIDNPRSIRWLKWLGARFREAQGAVIPFEISDRTFQFRQLSA